MGEIQKLLCELTNAHQSLTDSVSVDENYFEDLTNPEMNHT